MTTDLISDPALRAKLRKEVKLWADRRKTSMLFKIAQMNLFESFQLAQSINHKIKTNHGFPEKITFSMARQGIFQQLGVGKGTTIDQVGSTNRKIKPWISTALTDDSANQLANIIANVLGDEALDSINIQTFRNG